MNDCRVSVVYLPVFTHHLPVFVSAAFMFAAALRALVAVAALAPLDQQVVIPFEARSACHSYISARNVTGLEQVQP